MPPSKSAILRTPAKLERPLDRIFFFIIISFPCCFSKQATGKSLSLIPEKAGKGTLEKLTTKKQRNCCQELCQMKKKKKTILIIARHLHGWKQSGAIILCWHISLFLGTMKHTKAHKAFSPFHFVTCNPYFNINSNCWTKVHLGLIRLKKFNVK